MSVEIECDIDFDWTDKLIQAVQERPALYNRLLKEHADRKIVASLWSEVCQIMIPSWSNLTPQQKTHKGKDIQQKWRNLRTCFLRELNKQRKGKSGQAAKKRRKYIYFDKLLFLLPTITDKPTVTESDPPALEGNASHHEHESISPSTSSQSCNDSIKTAKKQKMSYEESLLKIILKEKQQEKIDEDKSFLLSLVPSFQKFSDDQKLEAKIQILGIIRNISQKNSSISAPVYETRKPNTCRPYSRQRPESSTESSSQSWLSSDNSDMFV